MLSQEPEDARRAFLIKIHHASMELCAQLEAIVLKYGQINQIVKFVIRFVLEV
jgi:hypothetical protein